MKNNFDAIGICGSLRKDSFNRQLMENVLASLALHGVGISSLSPQECTLPLLNEDLETKPLDQSILQFRAKLEAAPLVVVASPEYNAGPSAALKNMIDWASRAPKNLWEGKIVLLAAASPGSLGGVRGLIQTRAILSNLKAWVIPEQVQCGNADKAFTPDRKLSVDFVTKQIDTAASKAISLAQKLNA